MCTIQKNFIQESLCLQKKVHDIGETLGHTPMTRNKFQTITQELDETFRILKIVKERLPSHSLEAARFAELEEAVISLYGRTVDAWVHHEVLDIYEEAASLAHCLKCGRVTAGAVQKLAARLAAFHRAYRPSLDDRRLLAEAERIVQRADTFLKNDYIPQEEAPCEVKNGEETITDAMLANMEELMDIATLVYNHSRREAKIRYHQLAESVKKKFTSQMKDLGAQPFEDILETCQVLLSMAHASVGSPNGYLTESEIAEFFAEADQVDREDKVFSFRSIGSLGA